MKSRSLKGILNGAMIAIGVTALAAPWYGLIIYRHGLDPYISISQTGAHSLSSIFKILNVNILTEEPYLGLLGVLGILGMGVLLAKRDYFIPCMLPVIFFAQPRSGHLIGNIPLALAASIFTCEVILPWFDKEETRGKPLTIVFLTILTVYAFGNSIYYGLTLSERRLSGSDNQAMQWIRQNTNEASIFLVISGDQNAFCDPVTEWFPSLTTRKSLTTIQGSEWLLGRDFAENVLEAQQLQGCIDESLECISSKIDSLHDSFDYVYISISPPTENCNLSQSASRKTRGLVIALENTQAYEIAYQSEGVALFAKKNGTK